MGSPFRISGALIDEEPELREYRRYGDRLRIAVSEALPDWIRRIVEHRVPDHDPMADSVEAVISAVVADVDGRLGKLADADPTAPLSGPLEQIRQALGPVQDLLDELGAPPPVRDGFDARARPADRHSLGPMAFTELGSEVHQAGIEWGAAKAYVIARIRLN